MSMNEFLNIIKKSASEAVEAAQPVKLVIGEVMSADPLQIQIDQKITLTSEFLVLCREVTDYNVEMTVDHMTEKMQGNGKDPAFSSHAHPYKGRKVFKVHKKLLVGEKVLLAAMQGGQTYFVIDRVVQ